MDQEARRAEFKRLWERLVYLRGERGRIVGALKDTWVHGVIVRVLTPLYLARFPRRSKVTPKILKKEMPDEWEAAWRGCLDGANRYYVSVAYDEQDVEAGLVRTEARPRPGQMRRRYQSIYPNFTQGLGQDHYDKKRAEMYKLHAEQYGIKAEVVCERKETHALTNSRGYNTYSVDVFVDSEVDVEMLRFSPRMTRREMVKWCWGNGVNPRVYDPLLPHGFEEENGLDYFGGEVSR